MEWAEHQFRQHRKAADGATEGDHLESGARQLANLPGRKKPVEVIPEKPPFPDELEYVWRWYGELASGLVANGFGPPMVTWEAIRAWREEMDIGPVEPWEAKCLVDLGVLRATVSAEKAEAERKIRGSANVS